MKWVKKVSLILLSLVLFSCDSFVNKEYIISNEFSYAKTCFLDENRYYQIGLWNLLMDSITGNWNSVDDTIYFEPDLKYLFDSIIVEETYCDSINFYRYKVMSILDSTFITNEYLTKINDRKQRFPQFDSIDREMAYFVIFNKIQKIFISNPASKTSKKFPIIYYPHNPKSNTFNIFVPDPFLTKLFPRKKFKMYLKNDSLFYFENDN